MASSRVINNLNIRKFPTYASYKAATIGEDDLCVVTENGTPVIQVAHLPTASAELEGVIYQYVGATMGSYWQGRFYRCAYDGLVYYWEEVPMVDLSGYAQTSQSLSFTGMPGEVYQYVGETNQTYTKGYFYISGYWTGTITQTVGDSLSDLSIDVEVFKANWPAPATFPTSWQATFSTTDNLWTDNLGNTYSDLSQLGITFTGIPTQDDTISVELEQSWKQLDVQPSSGGGTTYTAGNGISIDANNEISVTAPTLQNTATGTDSLTILGTANTNQDSVNIGVGSSAHRDAVSIGKNAVVSRGSVAIGSGAGSVTGTYGISIGLNSSAKKGLGYDIAIGYAAITNATNAIAIGHEANVSANYAIQLGGNAQTNADANTFKVGNANGNFEIMSADGTVPTARLTKVNTTATLAAADWSSNTQTVSITGITADGVVMVSPTPANQSAYTSAGILCTAQAAGSLTFTCDTVPSADITVTVVML